MPPPPDRHVLSTRTSGTSRRRTESPSWFEKQALTGTCPSTPSEMRLVLLIDKGKAGVLCRACLDLPPAACPTFHGVRRVYARMQGGLTLPDAMFYSSADRSAVLDEYGILIH